MSDEPGVEGRRAAKLFFERWLEQLSTSYPSRRARTLGACAALDELLVLAESWVRSGGQTRPAIDPEDSGHGVLMLPDVADEAAEILRADEILRRRYAQRKVVLQDIATRLKTRENVSQNLVEQLRALLLGVRQGYLRDGFAELQAVVTAEPKHHEQVVALADALVSELRARGWSDEGLEEEALRSQLDAANDNLQAIAGLLTNVSRKDGDFECYVSVTLPAKEPPFPKDDPTFSLVSELPNAPRSGRPLKEGPYARVIVKAFDPMGAASLALRRVLSTLGALTVFLAASRIDVSSEVVAVRLVDGSLRAVEVKERLLEEKRFVSQEGITRILASSWRASSMRAADPLHDAIRLRHRALLASDAESRLLLLWSGLERMSAGARGFDAALSAAKELVSHAVTFGKLRRDIGDLAAVMSHAGDKDEGYRTALLRVVGGYRDAQAPPSIDRVDRIKVLEHLLGDEAKLRELLSVFYEHQPLLVHRCRVLWKDFGGGVAEKRGESIAEYHERSRKRIAWQVGRIYRARNRVAHIGVGPDRIRDLVWHAHFYLTQLVAICVHYGESAPRRAQEVLTRRMGQYVAFVELLRAKDPSCLTAAALMRPSTALGGE